MVLRLSRALSAAAIASFYVGIAGTGCSKVEQEEPACVGEACIALTRCNGDFDCNPGQHCGPNGKCIAECRQGDSTCPMGQSCSAMGKCVAEELKPGEPLPPSNGGVPGITGIPNIAGMSGSGGSAGSCVKAEVTFTKQIPNITLLVDRSGSMKTDFGGGGPRWNVLRDAFIDPLTGFVTELEAEVRFGLALYTAPDNMMTGFGGRGGGTPQGGSGGGGMTGTAGKTSAGGASGSSAGGASGNSSGGTANDPNACPWLIEVPVALNNLAPISQVYLPDDWRNGTPTGESLAAVWPKVAAIDQTLMPGPNFIILATDGEPNTCSGFMQQEQGRMASVAAVTAAKAAGITTFVVSVGEEVGEEHLRQIANLGQGFPIDDPMDRFYVATDTQGLSDALKEIIVGVRPCEFMLDGMVDVDKAADGVVVIDNMNLLYDDPNGWVLTSPTSIKLQGTACELIREGATMVNIDFPCGVFIPTIPQ